MLGEDAAAERIDLDLPRDTRWDARLCQRRLETEFQPADACEKGADGDHGNASGPHTSTRTAGSPLRFSCATQNATRGSRSSTPSTLDI